MQHLYILFFMTSLSLSAIPTGLTLALFSAVKRGNARTVKTLLHDLHMPVHMTDYRPTDENQTGFEETLLLCAIKDHNFNSKIFNLILAQGASVNQTAQNGLSPLHKAILFENEIAAQTLIIRGADTNAKLKINHILEFNALELAEKVGLTRIANLIRQTERLSHHTTRINSCNEIIPRSTLEMPS